MALQDIINDLVANHAKTDGSHYTVEQIKGIIANAPIDVQGAQPGATTLAYSGKLGEVDAWTVAEAAGEASKAMRSANIGVVRISGCGHPGSGLIEVLYTRLTNVTTSLSRIKAQFSQTSAVASKEATGEQQWHS